MLHVVIPDQVFMAGEKPQRPIRNTGSAPQCSVQHWHKTAVPPALLHPFSAPGSEGWALPSEQLPQKAVHLSEVTHRNTTLGAALTSTPSTYCFMGPIKMFHLMPLWTWHQTLSECKTCLGDSYSATDNKTKSKFYKKIRSYFLGFFTWLQQILLFLPLLFAITSPVPGTICAEYCKSVRIAVLCMAVLIAVANGGSICSSPRLTATSVDFLKIILSFQLILI